MAEGGGSLYTTLRPLKKGINGGYACTFSCSSHLALINEIIL